MTTRSPATPTRPVDITLTTELLARLTTRERALLPLLLAACAEMDEVFWQEASGDRNTVLSPIADPDLRSLVDFNYGPWDRRLGNAPLVPGVGLKPAGAAFYPPDMDVIEFEAACAESPGRAAALRSPHAVVRRDGAGKLVAVAYHEAFADHVERASTLLREAAETADDPALRNYLELRAEALLTDDYRASELAWLDMKDAVIDLIIGPAHASNLSPAEAADAAALTLSNRLAQLEEARSRGLITPDEYAHMRAEILRTGSGVPLAHP